MEIWKDIEGYEGRYQVSNLGRVKSLIGHPKILKEINNGRGYYQVSLCDKGEIILVLVHRLVAQAFIPNPDNFPCVNHMDENPNHNFVENLEWCSYQYNLNYGTAPARRSESIKGRKRSGIYNHPVIKINLKTGKKTEYQTMRAAAASTHFMLSAIKECCKGKRKSICGFAFEYKGDN